MKFEKGQMGELTFRDKDKNARWEYVVAVEVFDDRVEFEREYGGRYLYVINNETDQKELIDNQPTRTVLTPLFKDENPVFSKRSIFGKYTFKPKSK